MKLIRNFLLRFALVLSFIYPHFLLLAEVVQQKKDSPCFIVIFGATGDLATHKLIPAIYQLELEGHLPSNTCVVGVARRAHTDEAFRQQIRDTSRKCCRALPDNSAWDRFESKLFYLQMDFEKEAGYLLLQEKLKNFDSGFKTDSNRIYYLATPADNFPCIVEQLSKHQFIYAKGHPEEKWSRVIIEKPFGCDLQSAIDLQNQISKSLDVSQIFCIDHYLGKEGVQNLFNLRFKNGLFEPIWNHHFIDHVQITMSEDLGIGTRGNFWEKTGYLRDIFQNHLMQILAIIAMDPPTDFNVRHIHDKKIQVLNAIRPIPLGEMEQYIVRGQYGSGTVHGVDIVGYRQEESVAQSSQVETFVAAKFFIDNERWKNVPFYIRGGKRLPYQTVQVAITFKNAPLSSAQESKVLFIRIQPKPGIFFKTIAKESESRKDIESISLNSPKTFSEAYEKLIYDCYQGNQNLFVGYEEHLAAWRLLTPVLNYWKNTPPIEFPNYQAGTWPLAAEKILKQGHQWQILDLDSY